MKVGILGGGNISDTHARAALGIPGVEIAAICGANRQKAERLAQAYGGVVYDDVERFLEHRPLDIVAIGLAIPFAREAAPLASLSSTLSQQS